MVTRSVVKRWVSPPWRTARFARARSDSNAAGQSSSTPSSIPMRWVRAIVSPSVGVGCEAKEARAGAGSTSQAAGDLLAVLREVASDDAEVEARQDGTRRLSLQQEAERLGDELAGSGIRRQCADVILGDGHVVAASAESYGAA